MLIKIDLWDSFNVHGVLYVSEDEHMAPVEKEIRALAQGLQAVKDEQEYIVVRERVHRNTAESTNERVMWWSICQSILLFLVCAWQVYYLKVRWYSDATRLLGLTIGIVILRGQAGHLDVLSCIRVHHMLLIHAFTQTSTA